MNQSTGSPLLLGPWNVPLAMVTIVAVSILVSMLLHWGSEVQRSRGLPWQTWRMLAYLLGAAAVFELFYTVIIVYAMSDWMR